MPSTPSSIISDALGSLSKAANLALATVEDQARTDVARANHEASEGRRERDEALKALHALRLEEKEWERREEAWKASVDKSELTVKHQTETITQLRAEALQWKTQLLRLEESSRQEISDWKEQYLRAEQERCRLSSRIDELVAEQLVWNTHTNAATLMTTPRTPYPEFYDSSTSSTSTKRASTTVSHMPALAKSGTPHGQDIAEIFNPLSRKSKAVAPLSRAHESSLRSPEATPSRVTKQKAPPRTPHAAPTPSTSRADPDVRRETQVKVQQQPVQRVVRRVQATISVPVKEEDDSGADVLESDASGSAYEPEDEQPMKRRKSGRASARRQIRLDSEDDSDGPEEQQRHARRGSAHGRHRLVQENDSDVDELAMGAEEANEDAQRYVQRPNVSDKSARNKATGRPSTVIAAKKRKHDESAPAENSRAVTAKVARKK